MPASPPFEQILDLQQDALTAAGCNRLPAHRVVVQFDLQGACTLTMWRVLDRADVSVCLQHPGFDVDLLLMADLAALYHV